MTNDILSITTFNALILNKLRTPKCHFSLSFCPKVSFLRQMTFLNLYTFALQKNKIFPVNTGGVSRF